MHEQETTMTESHYSLRWNNHQSHILASFEALLEAGTLVDVTLVCADMSIRAHKVVLSACSPLFQRIFLNHPCKHPVIILSDFSGWVVQAIVAFIYKGEVSVLQDQLQALIKAAESLQIRGLANQDPYGADKESTSIMNQIPTPSTSPVDYDKYHYNNIPNNISSSGRHTVKRPLDELSSPFSPIQNSFDCSQVKLPHMSKLSFPEALMPRSESPIPRRKQARPRRRSGELSMAQDLTTACNLKPPSPSNSEETAENLCMKKSEDRDIVKEEDRKSCTPEMSLPSPELDMSTQSSGKEFRSSPVSAPQPTTNLKQEINNPSPLPYPPMHTSSALALTPPPNKYFGLESPLGLFPHSYDGCRNSLFDLADTRNVDSPLFVKKKMGRPKGQHSAPRGGPPRSWTNNELTEALSQVWKKRMTTSQASRVYGIPYNSLLMYVRGKYGKSLKLEQLRRDCLRLAEGAVEILGNMGNNNNNLTKGGDREQEQLHPNMRSSANDQEQHPMFNPFNHNYYPDFGTGFRLPLNMIHLLPQTGDKNRTEHNAYGQTALHDEELSKSHQGDIEEESPIQDLYRPPTLNLDDRRELVQQNGQD